MMIRHGFKLKRARTGQITHKCRETIEIVVRDPDGKKVFTWYPARGNLEQGLYETLSFVEDKLGLPLDNILEPKEIL